MPTTATSRRVGAAPLEGLHRFVDEHRGLAPEPLLSGLLPELGDWTGRPRAGFADDITLLVLDLRAD